MLLTPTMSEWAGWQRRQRRVRDASRGALAYAAITAGDISFSLPAPEAPERPELPRRTHFLILSVIQHYI